MSKLPDQSLIDRVQAEVQEIAGVLARQQRKSVREVWNEALTIHRVRMLIAIHWTILLLSRDVWDRPCRCFMELPHI